MDCNLIENCTRCIRAFEFCMFSKIAMIKKYYKPIESKNKKTESLYTNKMNSKFKTLLLFQLQIITLIVIYDMVVPVSFFYKPHESILPSKEDYASCNAKTSSDWVNRYAAMNESFPSRSIYIERTKHMYGFYLGRVLYEPLSLLALELGCTSNPVPIWRKFLVNINRISALETSKQCAKHLSNQVNLVHTTTSSLKNEKPFDVVVDSGKRSESEQIEMLKLVWAMVKPNGGIYVIEDVRSGGGLEIVKKLVFFMGEGNTYRIRNVPGYFSMAWFDQLYSVYSSLLSVECFAEACVLVKI